MSWRLSLSNNYTNTNVFSQQYISDLSSSDVSNYWVTTSSMLSRGEKVLFNEHL